MKGLISRIIFYTLVLMGACFAELTQLEKDSGWVNLFNGQDLTGFYTVKGGVVGENTQNDFYVADGYIRAKGVSGAGHVATQKKFSHYRFRVDMRFDNPGNLNQNAGVLYHIREDAVKLSGRFPLSMEAQGQKRGMGEVWSIGVWMETRGTSATGSCVYSETGVTRTHGEKPGTGGSQRQCKGSSVPFKDGLWNRLELYVRGADSSHHIVNGTTVFKAWDLRVGQSSSDHSDPLNQGNIGLQSEGAPIAYKNIHIMELDPTTGIPVHAKKGCTDSDAENYDSSAIVLDSSCTYNTGGSHLVGYNGGFVKAYVQYSEHKLHLFGFSESAQWEVFDVLGNSLYQSSIRRNATWNVPKSGMYFISVKQNGQSKLYKQIVLEI